MYEFHLYSSVITFNATQGRMVAKGFKVQSYVILAVDLIFVLWSKNV